MKKLTTMQIENINGGDGIDSFCASFATAAVVYQAAVWANIWNPVGQSAATAGAIIGGACTIYAIR
jgi:hypothetical protein